MQKLLIFSQSATGHHTEYLHHLYEECCRLPQVNVVIAVQERFAQQRELFCWSDSANITIDIIPDCELQWGGWVSTRWRFARAVRKYALMHNATQVFVLDFMLVMPFLFFFLPFGVQVSGIVYGLYVYRWKKLSWLQRTMAVILHWMLAKGPGIKNIFLLNDKAAARYYNALFRCQRFQYLPDPAVMPEFHEEDYRMKYNIRTETKIFFHFGSMGRKKGTLLILETILAMSKDELQNCMFVFAGYVQDSIRQEFYQQLDLAQKRVRILVFNEFCSYDVLGNWCRACTAILLPYLETYNSSGCIGYAACFGKPVIATGNGLLGKLVRRYRLGMLLPYATVESLRQALTCASYPVVADDYMHENTPEHFARVALS